MESNDKIGSLDGDRIRLLIIVSKILLFHRIVAKPKNAVYSVIVPSSSYTKNDGNGRRVLLEEETLK